MRVAEASSIEFYRVLNQNRAEDLAELKQFERREDITTYEPVLREIIGLFGQAIKTSLERTMGKYLQSAGGIYRNELREEWELEKVSQLLSHNNAAERPFGIVKAYLDVYKTMKLSTLASEFLSCDHKRVPPTCGHNSRENNENKTACAQIGWYSLDITEAP